MIMIFSKMALRNIFHSPRKSALAILAVTTCYFSLNLFQSYILGAEIIFRDSYEKRNMVGDLLVRRKQVQHFLAMDESDLFSKEEQEMILTLLKDFPVQTMVRFLRINGTISNGSAQTGFTGFGYDILEGEKVRSPEWYWNTMAGRPLANEGEIVMGKSLGKLLGCEFLSNEVFITAQGGYSAKERPYHCEEKTMQVAGVTLSGQANAIQSDVVGFIDGTFRELDLRFVNMGLATAQKLFDTDRISFLSLQMKPGTNLLAVTNAINKKLEGQNAKIVSWKKDEIGEFYQRTMDFLFLFRNFMMIVILSVALLSIFNTFFRNVQERVREIGVLKTLGFRNAHIRILFLLETFYLSLIGIFIGGVLSMAASIAVKHYLILYKIGLLTQPIPYILQPSAFTYFWTFLVVILISFLAAAIPLWRNEKISIVESLAST